MATSNRIPSWLETPPQSQVHPPVVTRKQELPFEELSWKDFERLCLRLVREEADIEYCQLYGQPGQEQEGIDFFARPKLEEKYRVYQCKRVEEFGPAKIKEAVDLFLAGEWAKRADTFVLCTKASFVTKGQADEVVTQTDRLRAMGKSFIPWDAHQLAPKLKDFPRLVDDFFGRAWVEEYCGDDVARSLGRRLDIEQVREFRKRLGLFYRRVFDVQDPGLVLPMAADTAPLPLEERYVLPDITERRVTEEQPSIETTRPEHPRSEMLPSDQEFAPKFPASTRVRVQSREYSHRRGVDAWLAQNRRHIILGGPGSGKSSLLRFLATDFLKEEPVFSSTIRQLGNLLPVWIPFAQWTRLIADPSTSMISLSEILLRWLKSWDEERLWPLIEQALEDERLLLLVDGLDEWTDESAARIALDRLRIFVDQHNTSAILTSRPHGFVRLGMQEASWQTGELSPFSDSQQSQLAYVWFRHHLESLTRDADSGADEAGRHAHQDAEAFLAELRQSPDLRELAQVPLLLSLLIHFRVRNARLPQSRFRAYDLIVEHLISTHPKKRKRAALVTDEPTDLSDEDIKKALAYLAYRIQRNYAEGLIDDHQATDIISEFLENQDYGLGLGPGDARKHSRQIMGLSEDTLGLLVRRSPQEVGFFHRAFQEYLTAYHLSRLPLEEQLATVENQCTGIQWREVVLALFQITKRGEDIKQLIGRVEVTKKRATAYHASSELLAEVAFGDFNCPVGLARRLVNDAFLQIELETWMPHRERVLHLALGGLRSTQVKEMVRSRVQHWFPCRTKNRVGLFNAMAGWPLIPETIECLWRGMHDEDSGNQRAAARALADLAKGDREIGDRIAHLARSANEANIQAVAIEALLRGWPEHPDLGEILEASRGSASPELRLLAILGRIQQKQQDQKDREDLIHLGSNATDLDYDWRDDVALGLLRGWPQDPIIKDKCLRSVTTDSRARLDLDYSIALYILLAGYPQDEDVASFCVKEIDEKEHSFLLLGDGAWQLLRQNYRDNSRIVEAIDRWTVKQAYADVEVAFAALVGRTPTAKRQLFNYLENGTFPHWAAHSLLEGWGMQDPEISERLTQVVFGEAGPASRIAYLLPRIVGDKALCRKRLVELLRDQASVRRDFIMHGLVALGTSPSDGEVVDLVLGWPPSEWADTHYAGIISSLIRGYSWDPRVRELAKRAMWERNAEYAPIATAYSQDADIRQLIIQVACPLPTSLRHVIAQYLSEPHSDIAFRTSVLQLYDLEQDASVKSQASIGYFGLMSESNSNVQKTVDALSHDSVCYGPDHEERRQAAFCGLVVLKHLERMLPVQESIGDPRPAAISVRAFQPNFPLVRLILQNWEYVNSILSDEIWSRLAKGSGQNAADYLWEQFCLFADEYPSVRDDALRYVDANPSKKIGPNALRFLARVRPRSSQLLEYCLNTMSYEKVDRRCSSADASTVAELLASNFGGDQEVLARLLSQQGEYRRRHTDEYLILALCEGWPESDELDHAFERICQYPFEDFRRQYHGHLDQVYIRLACVKALSPRVLSLLVEVLSKWRRDPRSNGQQVIRPFVTRVQIDDLLCEMVFDHLRQTPTTSEKVTFPSILAASCGVFRDLRDWCTQEIDRQCSRLIFPEMGLELSTGTIRPVAHALMDVLEQTRGRLT